MVDRCNAVGVRIYADIVVNHMVAALAGKGEYCVNNRSQFCCINIIAFICLFHVKDMVLTDRLTMQQLEAFQQFHILSLIFTILVIVILVLVELWTTITPYKYVI